MKKYQLDAFEQSIDHEADQYKPVSADVEKTISDKIDATNAQHTIEYTEMMKNTYFDSSRDELIPVPSRYGGRLMDFLLLFPLVWFIVSMISPYLVVFTIGHLLCCLSFVFAFSRFIISLSSDYPDFFAFAMIFFSPLLGLLFLIAAAFSA